MNCLEFRREKTRTPRQLSEAARRHAAECAACAAYNDSADRLEDQLEHHLRAPANGGLAERILLQHRLRHVRRIGTAAAAVLVAVTTLAIGFMVERAPPPLPQAAIDHVLAEPETLLSQQRVEPEALRAALAAVGARIRDAAPGVPRYAGQCPIAGTEGRHLVLDTPAGKVSLLLMPERTVSGREVRSHNGLLAVVKPAGRGSYALVADLGSDFADIEALFERNIAWF